MNKQLLNQIKNRCLEKFGEDAEVLDGGRIKFFGVDTDNDAFDRLIVDEPSLSYDVQYLDDDEFDVVVYLD